jgi:hypothetical protein
VVTAEKMFFVFVSAFCYNTVFFIQDSQNIGLMNGSAEMEHASLDNSIAEVEGEEECLERRKGHIWERGKAPWVEELKLNHAKKSSELNSTSSVDHVQIPPEQAEKKQAKPKLEPSKLQLKMIVLMYKCKEFHGLVPT